MARFNRRAGQPGLPGADAFQRERAEVMRLVSRDSAAALRAHLPPPSTFRGHVRNYKRVVRGLVSSIGISTKKGGRAQRHAHMAGSL